MGLRKGLEGGEGAGRSTKLLSGGWLKENDPEVAKGEASLPPPAVRAAPRVLGEREVPGLLPWERPRHPRPSARCRGQEAPSKAPWPAPALLRARSRSRASLMGPPFGSTPQSCVTPRGRNPPPPSSTAPQKRGGQHRITGEPLGSAAMLPSP